ncbi:hypothetical protein BofuT4_uP147190.1 [Botrytis cinerea T4]|uniref:Protein kinase domain-containing protein n=1 Tax=Botryotinia fuckeliana (strain T4) TaxID=999810 RepID=G2YXD8_BOTF4|nr:hypothetical protein BofuT4_uP147190.1 [Botrytis cinerea T4]
MALLRSWRYYPVAMVTDMQRFYWIKEVAEGLQLLPASEVIHSDANPKGFLLDAKTGLKIAGFGDSFLAGSKS